MTALRCFKMNPRKVPGRAPESFKIFFNEEHTIIMTYSSCGTGAYFGFSDKSQLLVLGSEQISTARDIRLGKCSG